MVLPTSPVVSPLRLRMIEDLRMLRSAPVLINRFSSGLIGGVARC